MHNNDGPQKPARIHPVIKLRSRKLRRSMTEAERFLWLFLRKKQLYGYRFRRQHPLGRYIVDFVCLEAGLIIEVDGGQHDELHKRDEIRTQWLERQGFLVLRFWNNEVLHEMESVVDMILRALDSRNPPPSRPSP